MEHKEIPAFIRCYLHGLPFSGRIELIKLAKDYLSEINSASHSPSSSKIEDAEGHLKAIDERFASKAYKTALNYGFNGGPYDPIAEAQCKETALNSKTMTALEFIEMLLSETKKNKATQYNLER